jgi:selenocysteine lyase/cysteine desulfurase
MSVENPYAFDNREYALVRGNRRTELGCPAFPAIFALGAAVDYALALGVEEIAARVLGLNTYLTGELERAGIPVLSPAGDHRSAETLCAVPDPPLAAAFLRGRGIEVTTKPQGLRISTHYYNAEPDVDTCVAALRDYALRFA